MRGPGFGYGQVTLKGSRLGSGSKTLAFFTCSPTCWPVAAFVLLLGVLPSPLLELVR